MTEPSAQGLNLADLSALDLSPFLVFPANARTSEIRHAVVSRHTHSKQNSNADQSCQDIC